MNLPLSRITAADLAPILEAAFKEVTSQYANTPDAPRVLGTQFWTDIGEKLLPQLYYPLLDDWVETVPDAWDYEAVLRDNEVRVEWDDGTLVDSEGQVLPDKCDLTGWRFVWQYGTMLLCQGDETIARKAAALFVSLWLRGISASFCDKLTTGYIWHLRMEGK